MFIRSYIDSHKGHPHYFPDGKIKSFQRKMRLLQEEEKIHRIARYLLDPTKLKIYLLLNEVEEISVSDISITLDLSQSAISHALSSLKDLGLVDFRKCGQLICYFIIRNSETNKILSLLEKLKKI
ncbi:MAG: winged helix-turn-helix transcriptional regulator [Candidatus Levybacteria bacterium]|nr:winged helix-turn-helix transcriptional regulator [Candidatus Levybacteria bacterium]